VVMMRNGGEWWGDDEEWCDGARNRVVGCGRLLSGGVGVGSGMRTFARGSERYGDGLTGSVGYAGRSGGGLGRERGNGGVRLENAEKGKKTAYLRRKRPVLSTGENRWTAQVGAPRRACFAAIGDEKI
jgi:hypothetical protein